MNRETVYPKDELRKRLHRFCWDEKRYMPISLFAKECGCSADLFNKVFKYQTHNLTEWLQIRASNVLQKWEDGHYAVMQNKHGQIYLKHLQKPKARLQPICQLVLKPGGIALKVGLLNKSDYGDKEGLFDATP